MSPGCLGCGRVLTESSFFCSTVCADTWTEDMEESALRTMHRLRGRIDPWLRDLAHRAIRRRRPMPEGVQTELDL